MLALRQPASPLFASILSALSVSSACTSDFQKVEQRSETDDEDDDTTGEEDAGSVDAGTADDDDTSDSPDARADDEPPVGDDEPDDDDVPLSAQDDQYGVCEQELLEVPAPGVLSNDTAARSALLNPTSDNGVTVSLAANGAFVYGPSDIVGTDRFVYEAFEGERSIEASVAIEVLPLAGDLGPIRLTQSDETRPFAAEEGILSEGVCQDVDLESSGVTEQGHPVDVEADGSFAVTFPAHFFGGDRVIVESTTRGPLRHEQSIEISLVVAPTELAVQSVTSPHWLAFPEQDLVQGRPTATALAGAGDVNQDGFDDWMIGGVGQAHLIFGSDELEEGALEGIRSNSERGRWLLDPGPANETWQSDSPYLPGGALDYNGDGASDLWLGLPGTSTQAAVPMAGLAELVHTLPDVDRDGDAVPAGATDLTSVRSLVDGITVQPRSGAIVPVASAIATAGDVNGDGYGDVLLAASNERIYLILGQPPESTLAVLVPPMNDATRTVGATLSMDGAPVRFSLGAAGDRNRDGFDDFLVGAPDETASGRVFLVPGDEQARDLVLTEEASVEMVTGAASGDGFGAQVLGGFDFNGDGAPDLAVSAPDAESGAGAVFLFLAELPSSADDADRIFVGASAGDRLGESLAAADVDGDGKEDLVLGAPGAHTAYVVYGASDPIESLDDLSDANHGFRIVAESGKLGAAVATLGDVDGDGFGDIAVGAPEMDELGTTFVLLGGDFGARHRVIATDPNGADYLSGDAQDNELTADGGPDVLLGGAGADRFHVPDDSFARIAGGHGIDRLIVDSGDLDLSEVSTSRISGIEVVDLSAAEAQQLTLSSAVLRTLPDSARVPGMDFTVQVIGNEDDAVRLTDLPCATDPTSRFVLVLEGDVSCVGE